MPYYSFGLTLDLPPPYGEDCACFVTVECTSPGYRASRYDPGYGPELQIDKVMIDTCDVQTMGKLYPLESLTQAQVDKIMEYAEENYEPDIWDDGGPDWEDADVA